MFSPACEVLLHIIEDAATNIDRGLADGAYNLLTSFDFVFILHLMKEIMGITDILCQALQRASQDILNAIHLVSSTKVLLQKLRDDGWVTLLATIKAFCLAQNLDIPDMSARYIPSKSGRACGHQDEFTIEHHYIVDIFYAAIDSQLQELNSRFNEHSMELQTLSFSLDPREHESFKIEDICCLVNKFYPQNFTDQEKIELKMQLSHYQHDVLGDFKLQKNFNS